MKWIDPFITQGHDFPFILATGPLPDILKHKDNHSSKNCKTYSWVHYVLYNIYTVSKGEGRQVQPPVYYNSSTTMKEWRNHELMNESYQNNSLVNNQNCNVQIHRRARSAIPQILHSCRKCDTSSCSNVRSNVHIKNLLQWFLSEPHDYHSHTILCNYVYWNTIYLYQKSDYLLSRTSIHAFLLHTSWYMYIKLWSCFCAILSPT